MHFGIAYEGVSRMDTASKKFYPYLEGLIGGYQGGSKDFYMELGADVPGRKYRIVSTPAGNRAVIWDFGLTSYNTWSIFLVDYEVLFTVDFADLESFWSVCDKGAAVTVALSGRRDRGLDARPCSPEEIERAQVRPSQEDLDAYAKFANTFSSMPVVNRFLFKILFPREKRPRPVH